MFRLFSKIKNFGLQSLTLEAENVVDFIVLNHTWLIKSVQFKKKFKGLEYLPVPALNLIAKRPQRWRRYSDLLSVANLFAQPDNQEQQRCLSNFIDCNLKVDCQVLGKVSDIIVDVESWDVPILVIRSKKYRDPVLIPTKFCINSNLSRREITASIDNTIIEASPRFAPSCVGKWEYEHLLEHYGG